MSEKSPDKEDPLEPSDMEDEPSSNKALKEKRIVILRERDIPFDEERPPNFSPHFSVKVHRIRKQPEQEDHKE